MIKKKKPSLNEAKEAISSGRKRTNILKNGEQIAIAYLVRQVPSWISSNTLTAIGLLGNLIVFASLIIGFYVDRYYLLVGVLGFIISWLGDSLDGRLAYYRKIPRKWYGFSLDVSIDWIGIIFIGLGFIAYLGSTWYILGYFFVALYGWQMITVIMKYKITGKYSIDSGLLGPTEARIIIALALVLEVFIPGAMLYFGIIANLVLLIVNIIDFNKMLDLANIRDRQENKDK